MLKQGLGAAKKAMGVPSKRAVKRGLALQATAKGAASSQDGAGATLHDAGSFAENMLAASKLWQQICHKMSLGMLKQPKVSVGHSDPLHIGESFMKVASKVASNPSQLYESQLGLWQQHLQLWHRATNALLGKHPLDPSEVSDRRFRDDAWNENSYFDYVRRSYLINSQWLQTLVENVSGIDEHTLHKVEFFTRQFLDAIAPSNFLLTNPEVMKVTLQSNGENLVRGLTQMLDDVERGDGKLRISMTAEHAFTLGETIAATKGQVVYENELMQLIQYAPATDKTFQTPILMIPAWINKYYVFDLREQNSMIKWLVDKGHTVFVISWVNPDESLAGKGFDDYLSDGPLAALDVIETITGSRRSSVIGYCLGGTLTSIMLAYLRAHGQAKRIASATFLTTLVDFSEVGDLSVFIDEAQLQSLEGRMKGKGYLEAADMANTFNMLRSNDLIWSFVVNHYLLGKEPFPFDLLYWNGDATRMPAAMHSFYLRNMYQKNLLIKPAGIEVLGTPINISKIETPCYLLSAKEDHIAPWQSTYLATQIYDGDVTFVLAQSGHIAGVINPPNKGKYGYYSNDHLPPRASEWLESATLNEGQSWWPHWHAWQLQYGGKLVSPPPLGGKHYPPIEAAPGAFARMKA